DAESADLEAQGVRERLDRVLCGVIDAPAREGQPAAHRADVDDPPPALPAHARQHQLAHPHQPEDVGLELTPHGLDRDLLNGAALTVAGVVDQDANRAFYLVDGPDAGAHRVLVGYVTDQR